MTARSTADITSQTNLWYSMIKNMLVKKIPGVEMYKCISQQLVKLSKLIGLLLVVCVAPHAVSKDKLFDETVNALPDTVLFSTSDFTVSEIANFTRGIDDNGYYDSIEYSAYGDLDGDSNPEIVISAWDYKNCETNESDTPLRSELRIFEANETATQLLQPQEFLGKSYTLGTAFIRILDVTGDQRNDLLIVSHNECPFLSQPSSLFERKDSGFRERLIYPGVAMHEGSIVDVNSDGHPDVVGSAYRHNDQEAGISKDFYSRIKSGIGSDSGIIIWINDGTGNFQSYVMKFDGAVEQSRQNYDDLKWINTGSAVTAADFDGDGDTELVVVDAYDTMSGDPSYGSVHLIIDDLKYEENHAYGKIIPLPDSFFRQNKAKFGGIPTNHFPEKISHSIQVDPMDYDNDGDLDILVNTFIWTVEPGESAGIVQIYRNDGALSFTDVTEDTLYNFNIGRSMSHDMIIRDVNGDGFGDIILSDAGGTVSVPKNWGTLDGGEGWDGELWSQYPRSAANEILINTGNGKFVSAFWEGFENFLEQRQPFFEEHRSEYEPWGMGSEKMHPYLLNSGKLGFIFKGDGYPNQRFYFDARAKRNFRSGPKGVLSADRGAPGYSEYYYLTEYPEVAASVGNGDYIDGLDHYIKVGKSLGYQSFANNSIVHGGSNDDVINLLDGKETAYGYEGNDQINGGSGDDIISGGGGNDTIYGGADSDVAVFSGVMSGYEISWTQSNQLIVKDIDASNGNDGSDILTDIEFLSFYDVKISAIDSDGDGFGDDLDAFPLDSAEQIDSDGDGTGNNADTDDDNDGVNDSSDTFPLNATETIDTDSDGIGNNTDTDDDDDGLSDSQEATFGTNPIVTDTDGDDYSDNEEVDYETDPLDRNSSPILGGLNLTLIKAVLDKRDQRSD
jgi:hypothetical protein